MKKLIVFMLLTCVLLGLCACGNNQDATPPSTIEWEGEIDLVDDTTTEGITSGYTVKVVDEGGNPIAGALVQLCAEACIPAVTDANGVATFPNAETRDDYKVSFVSLPAGYDYVDENQQFYFAEGATEITLTLKAIA